MIEVWQSIILGIVEGFTEFLPISSTAHLVFTAELLGLDQTAFARTFEIAIQSGAILAVLVIYWRKFLDWLVLKKLVIAFIPTGVLGIIFYPIIKNHLLNDLNLMLWALGLGGLFLILFERFFRPRQQLEGLKSLGYGALVMIGIFQAVAMVPGVSRAAATIVGGLILGVKRSAIVEFSFLLAVPTMLAATGLDLVKNWQEFSANEFGILAVGLAASFIMALLSIKFLLNYIRRHTFTSFGIYRIVLVTAVVLAGLLNH